MFFENYAKLNGNLTQLTKKLAQADKTLKIMESQLAISKSVNEAFQNRIIRLERQRWKNMNSIHNRSVMKLLGFQTLLRECELIETAPGISITPGRLEACHHLQDAAIVLSKKNKAQGFNLRSAGFESGKVFINESLCCYYKFL